MSDSNYSDQDTKNDTVETNPTKVFFKTLFQQVIWLIIYIFVGGYMLYCAKISQCGLMPTDVNLMPYRSESTLPDKPIEPIININYIKEKDFTLTNKIYFPYIYNKEIIDKSFLIGIGSSRSWIESLTSNVYTYYFGSIWQSMTALYIQLLFGFYGIMNANCIETLIIFGGPYIIVFVLFFINIIVGIYGVFLYFAYIPKLFSQKRCVVIDVQNEEVIRGGGGSSDDIIESISINQTEEPIVEWNDNPKTKGFGYSWFMTALVVFIALFACLFGSLLITTYFLIRSNISALFLPLFTKAQEINEDSYNNLYEGKGEIENIPHKYDDDEEYTYYTVIEHILKFKKRIIMIIVSYYVLIDSYSSLGSYGAILAIVGCILLYIFFPDIYRNYKKITEDTTKGNDNLILNNDNLTPVIGTIINKMVKNGNKEPIKRDPCDDINNPPKKIGFIGRLWNFLKNENNEVTNATTNSSNVYDLNGNPISNGSSVPSIINKNGELISNNETDPSVPTIIGSDGEPINKISPSGSTVANPIGKPAQLVGGLKKQKNRKSKTQKSLNH